MGMFDDLIAQHGPTRITVRPGEPDTLIAPEQSEASAIARSFTRGLKDPVDAGAQLLTRGLESIAPEGSWFQKYMEGERQRVEQMNAAGEAEYAKANPDPGFDVPRLLGNATATAPISMAMPGATAPGLGARTASGFVSGGVTGALQPVDPMKGGFWEQKAGQTGMGAVGGTFAPAIAGSSARVVSPNISPDVQALRAQGVKLTPGQTLGGAYNRVEEGLQSIPLVGDLVKNARGRAVDSFNRTTINRVLEPIGKKLPADIPMGRQAVDKAHQTVSDVYDSLLPQLKVQADPKLVANLQSIMQLAGHLEPGYAKTFENILRTKLMHRFSPGGGMTGEGFKTAESELGRLARSYSSSSVAGERELGLALRQVQEEMRDLLTRSNPSHADRLQNINQAWAGLVRVEDAANRMGTQQGVFTPSQLAAAIRNQDKTARKSAYARGDAMMQGLSDQGTAVLGNKVPDSGTPYRGLTAMALGGGAGAYLEPSVGVPAALGSALIAGAYSKPGAGLLGHMFASRPAAAKPIASVLRNNPMSTPFLSALLASQANQ